MFMFARGDYPRMQNWVCGALAAILHAVALLLPVLAAENAPTPNFSPDNVTGWLKPPGDEFLPPASGPGPIKSDPAHPYVSNAIARQETVKIADLTNPILQPWVVEQMRKANDEVLAGKVGFTARSRCWPHGVPGFLLYAIPIACMRMRFPPWPETVVACAAVGKSRARQSCWNVHGAEAQEAPRRQDAVLMVAAG